MARMNGRMARIEAKIVRMRRQYSRILDLLSLYPRHPLRLSLIRQQPTGMTDRVQPPILFT